MLGLLVSDGGCCCSVVLLVLVDLCSLEFDCQCLHWLVVTLDGIIQSLGSFLLLTVNGSGV